jgi:hypothetical protein
MFVQDLIWEEVSHSYTEAAAEGDVVVGKRKSPKGEYVKRTPTPMKATVVVTLCDYCHGRTMIWTDASTYWHI